MTPAALEVLGRDSATYAVAFRRGDDETTATTVELATARNIAARTDVAYVHGIALDESEVTALIKADSRDDLALYPEEFCGCGVAAVQVVEGEPMCHPHLRAFGQAEEESA